MTNLVLRRPLAELIYLALAGPLLAAQPPFTETGKASSTATVAGAANAATVCRDDCKSFDSQIEKDRYWRPLGGYGFG